MLTLPAPLVLASTSKYRRAQLNKLGLPFVTTAPAYDELPVPGLDARQLIVHHARSKAEAVAADPHFANAWVLAADQGAVLGTGADAVLLGKPGTVPAAVAQLLQLAGKSHELLTHVVLRLPDGTVLERSVSVTMQVRPLTRPEAEAYVAFDMPLDCAGAYKIESGGPWILTSCRGDDPTAIEGLPLLAVTQLLHRARDGYTAGTAS